MKRNVKTLVGQKFSNLVVIEKHPEKGRNSKWVCKCLICGRMAIVTRPNLLSGNTVDCGCRRSKKIARANTTHGGTGSPIYKRWATMRSRVEDPNKNYKKRGILVCEEWGDYPNFEKWAIQSGFREELELDRIDNSKGYSPDNCRWVSHSINCQNRDSSGLQFSVVSNLGEKFPSAQKASIAFNRSRSAVSTAIKTGHRAAGRYWKKQ
jgi:hypothetical protein